MGTYKELSCMSIQYKPQNVASIFIVWLKRKKSNLLLDYNCSSMCTVSSFPGTEWILKMLIKSSLLCNLKVTSKRRVLCCYSCLGFFEHRQECGAFVLDELNNKTGTLMNTLTASNTFLYIEHHFLI